MAITATLVKELRELTNAGMMECKKALVETKGDLQKAVELIRKSGQVRAIKKATRVAGEGVIIALSGKEGKSAILVEVNCETDFVAREEKFKQFCQETAQYGLDHHIKTAEALQAATDRARLDLVAQLGENVTVRRVFYQEMTGGMVGTYVHGDANGIRIGAMVALKKGSVALARDLAMQVAAMNPEYLTMRDIPEVRLNKEKEIYTLQTLEELKEAGKSLDKADMIIAGKLKKFAMEITLLGQSFVKDPDKTVEKLLKETDAEVESFIRFEVGEGIEKKEANFVEEVMAQVRGV